MRRALLVGGAAFAFALVVALARRPAAAPIVDLAGAGADLEDVTGEILGAITPGSWSPPVRAAPYLPAIYQAEDANGIPRNGLARLLYEESRFRDDIISGRTVSPAGALGIAQFEPATAAQEGFNPLDPYAAIAGAGRYLAKLKAQLGSWEAALAAYNWGVGNVQRKGLVNAPAETRQYVARITGDVSFV